ncbi:MAG TPA: helix-turn-helix domain-containing protein [Candidatus Dormibacteraeota bacterium]|nr:helix-turn-helix domain-containing protein [Candidatus Dormibacteraeota bacterium]
MDLDRHRARAEGCDLSEPLRDRRRYDGSLRRQQAAETRERIVAAGSEILHGSPIRDWRALTIRAAAERAGVNQRTVYRHFVNERGLRDAVMHRLEEEAGIDLAGLRLEDIAAVTARIFEHVSAYPREPRPQLDPTLTKAGQRQRNALLGAVAARTAGWQKADRLVAAAMLDVLWSVASYERLVVDWQLDRKQVIRGITWVIGLVEEAVRKGRRPK